jgi:hypothetical protein
MLYTFSNLAKFLTELGFPEATEQGFKVIRKDLTAEEKAGNLEYEVGGIYLTVGYQKYKGYMYMKYYNIVQFGFPKFHITNCKTILEQRSRGKFDSQYFWHNSNTVSIQDRNTGEEHKDVTLELCWNCRRQSNISEYNSTAGFFKSLGRQEHEMTNPEIEVDIFGYTRDWQQISKDFRRGKEFTCERCAIRMENPFDKRFIHVHHRNGDKLNNRKANLQCLCILCHSHIDDTHVGNFQKRRIQADIKAFVSRYRDNLRELGNPYVNQY